MKNINPPTKPQKSGHSMIAFGLLILVSFANSCTQCSHDHKHPHEKIKVQESNSCSLPPAAIPANLANEVHPNCFSNINRLGLWTGGTNKVQIGNSPSEYFTTVTPSSINNLDDGKGIHLYVVTHGWAPGLVDTVVKANYDILWWGDNAKYATGTWESSWFWTPTYGGSDGLLISETGLIQQIIAHEAAQISPDSVIVLAYSWIDDSATEVIALDNLAPVQYSEAYTNLNGLRLSQAIQEVVGTNFLSPDSPNQLHLIGHSHGSKVATVAAMELQNTGLKVDHLTTLDSPEEEETLIVDAANFLGYYFNQMSLYKSPSASSVDANGKVPILVDNYTSEFGVRFRDGNCDSIVNTTLYPSDLFAHLPEDSLSQKHAYSGTWYAGASVGAAATGNATAGLDWPPVRDNGRPLWYQSWHVFDVNASSQWNLHITQPDGDEFGTYTYLNGSTTVNNTTQNGPVTGNSSDTLVFSGTGNSSFYGEVDLVSGTDQYGIAYTINWENPSVGDYFVATVLDGGTEEVIQVFDGKSMATGSHNVSFNADYDTLKFNMYFFPVGDNANDKISISNFEYIQVSDAN